MSELKIKLERLVNASKIKITTIKKTTGKENEESINIQPTIKNVRD